MGFYARNNQSLIINIIVSSLMFTKVFYDNNKQRKLIKQGTLTEEESLVLLASSLRELAL
jgi:hypothetical protein